MSGTLPMKIGSSIPTRRDGLAAVSKLESQQLTDPNNARAKRRARLSDWALGITMAAPLPTGSLIGLIMTGTSHGAASGAVLGLMATVVGMIPAIGFVQPNYRRTLALPAGMDAGRVEAMLAMLIHVSHEGLRPVDRASLQTTIDDASDVLSTMLGSTPRALLERSTAVIVPRRLSDRGDRLGELAPALVKEMHVPHGASYHTVVNALVPMVQIVEALARDFGLDPAGFGAEPVEPALGRADMARLAVADDPDSPAAAVRRLAQEWLQGPRRTSDDGVTAAAETAASSDIDELEAKWATARAHAVAQDLAGIDEEFAIGCRMLSARLSSAIHQRSAMLRDDLATDRRYLEAKHADAVDPIVGSLR